MNYKPYPCRNACAIDLGDSVVVTGGGRQDLGDKKVTRYNGGGFVEDLPDLITARRRHACAYFVNADNQMVESKVFVGCESIPKKSYCM